MIELGWVKKRRAESKPAGSMVGIPPSEPGCPCPYCAKAYDDGYRRGLHDAQNNEKEEGT